MRRVVRIGLLGDGDLLATSAPATTGGLDPVRLSEDLVGSDELDAIVAVAPTAEQRERLDRSGRPALIWAVDAHRPGPAANPGQRIVDADGVVDGPWRSVALPIADDLFAAPARPIAAATWLGAAGERREGYLASYRHSAPFVEDGAATIAVNLRDEEGPRCERHALVALAAGMLLITEPLRPLRGLEPGIDHIEAHGLDDLFVAVEAAVNRPEAFETVRIRGRRRAELFRASAVIERLVGDLLLEVR